MKKIITLLLAVLMCMSLAACGSKESNNTNSNDNNTVANPLDAALISEGTIIIGTSPDYPPFETLSAAGELEGFDIDMVNAVVSLLNEQNGTNYTVTFKQMDFSTIISALQASQIDVGVSGFTYSPDRDCIFSTPYIGSNQVVVTRVDTGITTSEDLVGKKVAAGTGTTGAEALAEIIGEGNVQHPGDYTVMFQALAAGQLDAVVCDEAVGVNYVNEMNLVMLAEPLVDEQMSIVIKTGNDTLAAAVNAAVEAFVASEDYNTLLAKWELN
ncbi:MAG: transporter substrate-binding domain-containing protein [Erysipelotrichaceae bacterium]|nr:transporter substrate-binding domain-containing protein [Erysipelotrichaceae bacterium]